MLTWVDNKNEKVNKIRTQSLWHSCSSIYIIREIGKRIKNERK